MRKSITQNPVRGLIGLQDAASRMGISVWTLRHWICEGKFPSFKLRGKRLVDESEVEEEIRRSRQEVTAA
jgi:excisionase family DNA binding protein